MESDIQAVTKSSPLKRPLFWLPILLAPIAIAALMVYYHFLQNHEEIVSLRLGTIADSLEWIAPWILVAVVAVYWAKMIFTRNPTYMVFTIMTACLLLRELHWAPAIKKAIFPLLGICLFWALVWRDVIDKPGENWKHTIFLVCALATYGLAQFVEKRLFKFLPYEDIIHTQMEEITEVSAHILLLMAALFANCRKWPLRREKS